MCFLLSSTLAVTRVEEVCDMPGMFLRSIAWNVNSTGWNVSSKGWNGKFVGTEVANCPDGVGRQSEKVISRVRNAC